MKLLTCPQIRELDRYTIEHEPIDSIDLMERASVAASREIACRWDQSHTLCIFAGPGNNGGDGLAIARLLALEGYRVRVWLFNTKDRLSPDCAENLNRLSAMSEVELTEVRQSFDFPALQPSDIIIDALFGTGLNKPLNGGFAVITHKINTCPNTVVSIDIPSGLMSEDNTYNDLHNVVKADLTLTMQLPKLAFLLPDTAPFVGEWKALDIQLADEGIQSQNSPFYMMEAEELRQMLRPRPTFAHKGTMGHALLIAGSLGMAGASILAAKACLRSGVGKLTLHTASANGPILQTSVPEAVLHLDEDPNVVSQCTEIRPFSSIGIGPGLGLDELTLETVCEYLCMSDSPLVIDADAINALAQHPEWVRHIPSESILTPHVRELEGLIGQCPNAYERLMRTQDWAIQHQLFVVIKGHYSTICTPTGKAIFCPTGNAGMATPGSGDVLTGILTGLLAQGYTPYEAAQLGVWLHGTAGDLAADDLEQECMLASDIISHLPGAFRKLKGRKNKT